MKTMQEINVQRTFITFMTNVKTWPYSVEIGLVTGGAVEGWLVVRIPFLTYR